MDFQGFPKIPRLNREIVITEKIDGTNAQVLIRRSEETGFADEHCLAKTHGPLCIFAGSRNRYLTPGKGDNFGFAAWVYEHADALIEVLGEGQHFGEWHGAGIQRTYGLGDKYFALFNMARWGWLDDVEAHQGRIDKQVPAQLTSVPVLYKGKFDQAEINYAVRNLQAWGSRINRFPNPEGVIVYHTAANQMFKVLVENDEGHKG